MLCLALNNLKILVLEETEVNMTKANMPYTRFIYMSRPSVYVPLRHLTTQLTSLSMIEIE